MVTQLDVAKLAGTSAAVVSYVLNNGPRPVAEDTRMRVLAAMAELDFRPNNAARSLRSGKSQVLGLVIPDSSHPFFADVARQMEKAAYELGYVILTGNSMNDPAREKEYFSLFREHQVDGVLLTVDPIASVEPLSGSRIPVVLMDQPAEGTSISSVCVDYYAAAYDATKYLISQGHTRVGFIGGPNAIPSAAARFAGWSAALDDAGLAHGQSRIVDFTREAGRSAGIELLSANNRITAAFISSDQQAVGFMRGAALLGLEAPRDVSVIAFDDSDDCLYTNPPLSAVRQPIAHMIDRALELLLTTPDTLVHEVFRHQLILRQSTGDAESDADLVRTKRKPEKAPSRQ
jgi:LacI family transcriptional regulator